MQYRNLLCMNYIIVRTAVCLTMRVVGGFDALLCSCEYRPNKRLQIRDHPPTPSHAQLYIPYSPYRTGLLHVSDLWKNTTPYILFSIYSIFPKSRMLPCWSFSQPCTGDPQPPDVNIFLYKYSSVHSHTGTCQHSFLVPPSYSSSRSLLPGPSPPESSSPLA